MAITIDGVTYRNLPEQVEKNKKDIEGLQNSKLYKHVINIKDEASPNVIIAIMTDRTPITEYSGFINAYATVKVLAAELADPDNLTYGTGRVINCYEDYLCVMDENIIRKIDVYEQFSSYCSDTVTEIE